MHTVRFGAVFGAGVAMALALASQPARAGETRFALTCVGTETGYEVYYQYRWGNKGEWTNTSVEPGKWKNHTYDYDYPGENRSPQFQVRYDDDASDDTHFVITKLDSYAADENDCESDGATYDFHQRGEELYLVEND